MISFLNPHLTVVLVAVVLTLGATPAAAGLAPTFDFVFTGQCDDCAFTGDPSDIDFDPFDDGLFETVTGTLRLTDITPNGSGFIDVDSNNFDSFSYSGSSLLNPFTFTDPFTITGEISAAGVVQPSGDIQIETSAGDFSNFCTPLGEEVLGQFGADCGSIGLAFFFLASDGFWGLSGSEPFDTGEGGQLAPIPEPVSGALLGLGLIGVGLARRRRVTRN